jgi:2-polyprenyl-3-methyl-5-hydroxy-6-metoxy-1,4-benzoquinol methylase
MATCPICSSSATRLRFEGRTNRNPADGRVWVVYECEHCAHGFINPQPSAATLKEYYSSSYEAYDDQHGAEADDAEVIARAKAAGEFRHIPIPAGKKILDFGCGGGFFLRICRELGAQVQGIEPSPFGAEITRKQNIPVFEGSLDDFLEQNGDQRFDVITSNHVLEHVPNPIQTLEGLRSLLAPGGVMTITVPNATSAFAKLLGKDWYNTDLPFHLHQFSAMSLRCAAERAALTTQYLGTTSLPAGSAASLRLVLRQKFMVPQRLSVRLPGIERLGASIAARHDRKARGEALLARFAA